MKRGDEIMSPEIRHSKNCKKKKEEEVFVPLLERDLYALCKPELYRKEDVLECLNGFESDVIDKWVCISEDAKPDAQELIYDVKREFRKRFFGGGNIK